MSQSCSVVFWVESRRFRIISLTLSLSWPDLALRLDIDRPGQVAAGDRRGDRLHRPDLGREVGRELVDVVGQVAPGAGHAADVGLAAELALRAHLAGHAGHLGGERAQLVDHRVDGVLELEDLAAHVDRDLAWLRSPFATAVVTSAMLRTWLVRLPAIEVDVVGQVLPGARTPGTSAWPPSLPSVPTSRATRVTSLAQRAELVDHRVDGVLELEDLALDVDRDLAAEVALRDGGRHLGDVADLARSGCWP